MKHIEFAELQAMGLSNRGLNFYNGTNPLCIIQHDDGSFTMDLANSITHYNTQDDLIADMEELAMSFETPKTWSEYMVEHNTENFSWCKPYVDTTGNYAIVMHDGIPESAVINGVTYYRYNGELTDEIITEIAKAVNPDYDLYSGYNNYQIAIMAMQETGCAHCPFFEDCSAMGEEMTETDNR